MEDLEQVRVSDFSVITTPLPPLMTAADILSFLGVAGPATPQMNGLAAALSTLVRGYTGRILTQADFKEVFRNVLDVKSTRFTREFPVVVADQIVLSYQHGRIQLTGGPELIINYTAGYDPLPADLQFVISELFRSQAVTMGLPGFTDDEQFPEKSVAVGQLKVEYAINTTSANAKANSAGGLTLDALTPYAHILNLYVHHRMVAAT